MPWYPAGAKGERGGFTVHYGGEQYEFEIAENTAPRPVGEIGRLVKASGRYAQNGLLTEADKRVIKAFVAERAADSRLLDTDGYKLDKMGLGGETIAFWSGGRIAIVSTESVKSDESIIRAIVKEAGPGVVDFSYARKGHRQHAHGATARAPMRENGRGIYHETAAGKHDMVLHQGHRGGWRIDLVTSAGGNHTDVTGPNKGYGSAEQAFQAALDEQRVRSIRGKSHVWIADRDGVLTDYEPMEANGSPYASIRELLPGADRAVRLQGSAGHGVSYLPYSDTPYDVTKSSMVGTVEIGFANIADARDFFANAKRSGSVERAELRSSPSGAGRGSLLDEFDTEGHSPNGRRTGILSDGTRVNVYYDDKTPGEPWTVVPHGMDWDAMERGGMRTMLGMSETGSGISQFTEGQEGRHLGRSVPWDAVPENIRRHIERRLVSEGSMVANARKKKGVTVDDLPAGSGTGGKVLACPSCGAEFSAMRSDYFMLPKGEVLACQSCHVPLVLRKRTPERLPPPQEARHSPGNRAWDTAEDKGLVRIVVEDEQENYFDVYEKPESEAEYDEIVEIINRDGLNHFASQYRKRASDPWETADSIGMVIGDLASSGYEDSLKQAALDALKTAQKKR